MVMKKPIVKGRSSGARVGAPSYAVTPSAKPTTPTVKGRSSGARVGAPVYHAWTPEKSVGRATIKEKGRLFRENPNLGSNAAYYDVARQNVGSYLNQAPQPQRKPPPTSRGGGGGGRGGYSRGGYGGGGGGGGGPTEAQLAQNQIDYLSKLLASNAFRATPISMDAQRQAVANASAQDQAAAANAYNALDQWLAQNQANPYANVQLQNARFAPAQNAYLASQGVGPMNEVTANPEDVGAQGAFRNVLSLLGAGQQASQQSRAAESQMARTFAGQQIGALDNAYLAQIGQQEQAANLQRQQQLDQARLQAAMQLAALVGQGGTAPDLSALGYA